MFEAPSNNFKVQTNLLNDYIGKIDYRCKALRMFI